MFGFCSGVPMTYREDVFLGSELRPRFELPVGPVMIQQAESAVKRDLVGSDSMKFQVVEQILVSESSRWVQVAARLS